MDHSHISFNDDSMFANIFSFAGRSLTRDLTGVDAVVMGIPYDLATSGRSGARHGPMAIRQASAHLRWEEQRYPWEFAAFDRLNVVDYGDLSFSSGDSEDMLRLVEEHARRVVAAGASLVTLGGDHFVTLPLLRAHAATHGPLALIHFDAHTDTYDGERYDHGSMFHHAPREGLIDPSCSVQIGIRTEYTRQDHPFMVLDASHVNDQPAAAVAASIRQRVGQRKAYLTFDIDCLDPAFAPGTGTPVVGGLSSGKALDIVRELADLNVVGCDLVEVSPPFDHAEMTALAGATLTLQLLYVLASGR